MYQKSVKIFIVIMLLSGMGFTQNWQVVTAYNALNDGKLDEAKEAIDAAIEHQKTSEKPKTWFYRGKIYLSIHISQIPVYKDLDTNALDKSYEAFQKAIELEAEEGKRNTYYQQSMLPLSDCGVCYFIEGRDYYLDSRYERALERLEKAVQVKSIVGETDTLSLFVAAASAEALGQYEKAVNYFEKVESMNLEEPAIYRSLFNIYYNVQKNEEKAVEYLTKGREKFPEDINIIKSEISFFLQTNRIKEAKKNIELAIEKEPNNHILYFAQGTIYDTLGQYDKAVESYQKSLEIQPDYFESIFNLGATHYNRAIEIINEIKDLPPDDQTYAPRKAEADGLLEKAAPYFEKALEIHKKDYNSLIALKEIYARTNNMEKLKEVNAKLAEIK